LGRAGGTGPAGPSPRSEWEAAESLIQDEEATDSSSSSSSSSSWGEGSGVHSKGSSGSSGDGSSGGGSVGLYQTGVSVLALAGPLKIDLMVAQVRMGSHGGSWWLMGSRGGPGAGEISWWIMGSHGDSWAEISWWIMGSHGDSWPEISWWVGCGVSCWPRCGWAAVVA